MHAIRHLKQEHGKAKAGFQEIESAPQAQRQALWKKLRPELEHHEQEEERCLYGPVAREVQQDQMLADWERTHHHQVQEAENLIREIDHLDPADQKWLAAVQKLRSTLEQHIQKEEGQIWPRIEQVWDAARLEEAGRQMEAMQKPAQAA
jgi:hemerythrin-like domain-containing protein